MAHKKCARCAGTKKPATVIQRFGLDDEQYELALCAEHGLAFQRDIGAWMRIADELTPEVHRAFSDHSRELSIERAAKHVFTPKPPADPKVVVVQKLPAAYHLWGLTDHAKERCAERGVSERDALICAADPAVTFQHPQHEGSVLRHHKRGSVIVLCNTETKSVVTVMTQAYFDAEQEREAVHG